jgi:antitoxin PrlF
MRYSERSGSARASQVEVDAATGTLKLSAYYFFGSTMSGGESRCSCGAMSVLLAFNYCSNSAILQYMKATVTITSRGVITLPAKLRQALGLKADDHLIAETTPEGLLLRPAVTLPVEMYTAERVREFDAAEYELAVYLGAKAPAVKRGARTKRKSRG